MRCSSTLPPPPPRSPSPPITCHLPRNFPHPHLPPHDALTPPPLTSPPSSLPPPSLPNPPPSLPYLTPTAPSPPPPTSPPLSPFSSPLPPPSSTPPAPLPPPLIPGVTQSLSDQGLLLFLLPPVSCGRHPLRLNALWAFSLFIFRPTFFFPLEDYAQAMGFFQMNVFLRRVFFLAVVRSSCPADVP